MIISITNHLQNYFILKDDFKNNFILKLQKEYTVKTNFFMTYHLTCSLFLRQHSTY